MIVLDLPHVRLRALSWGSSSDPLALLLHGFPDTAHTWRHLGPALADAGYHAVAPFSRGYAPSDLARDGRGDIGALMADAAAAHRHLGGDDDAVLIGHDWGAEAANGLAAHTDSPYRRVVSMAVPPAPALYQRPALRHLPRQAVRSWYIGYHQLPVLPERTFETLLPRLWGTWSPAYDAAEDLAHVHAALPDTARRRAAIDYYRHAARPWSVPAEYRKWQAALTSMPRVPFLYLHGRDDGCLGAEFAPYVDRVGQGLPPGSAVHVVPDAGHFLQLERPDLVNRLILDFLAAPTAAAQPLDRQGPRGPSS